MIKYYLLLFLFTSIYAQSTLPEPYNEIVLLPFCDTYDTDAHEKRFRNLFSRHKIETVIEVGSWMGSSARYFASRLPLNGKVYAVDHWLGSEEQQQALNDLASQKSIPADTYLYQQFLSNVIHKGLTNKIIPIRMFSVDAAKYLTHVKADLIYIDASHNTKDVLDDLRAWYPYVENHGVFCGDDWTCEGVATAVKIFAKEKNLLIRSPSYNFWCLFEPARINKF